MKEDERRSLLKVLTEDQYQDVVKVCGSMPLINFKVQCEVLDDEESAVVTAGAIVTVTVTLTRNTMSSLLTGDTLASTTASEAVDADEQVEDETKEASDDKTHTVQKKPVWQRNKKGGGKKAGANKKAQPKKQAVQPTTTLKQRMPSGDKENEDTPPRVKELKELPIDSGETDEDEDASEETPSDSDFSDSQDKDKPAEADDDKEWEKCQTKLAKNKERALEGKSKISHPVHCPYFPDVKQEYWWTYVSDRKNKQLLTAPYLVTDLIDVQECELQFTAPRKTGHYTFTVCLRSDSYLGFDQLREIKLDVQEAKEIEEHPQWDISEDEEEKAEDSEESEYATDDDIEEEDEE